MQRGAITPVGLKACSKRVLVGVRSNEANAANTHTHKLKTSTNKKQHLETLARFALCKPSTRQTTKIQSR